MSSEKIKISYSATQQRIRAVFPAEVCVELSQLPPELFQRAQSKLESEKKNNHIATYKIFHEQATRLWDTVRDYVERGGNRDEKITITIGLGAPELKGLEINPSPDEKTSLLLTIDAPPAEVAKWNFDWVKIIIEEKMANLGIEKVPHAAQFYSTWHKAARGEMALNTPILLAPVSTDDSKPYSIIGNKVRKEVYLVIRDPNIFHDTKSVEKILRAANDASAQMSKVLGAPMNFLKDGLIDRFKSAMNGPEKFGFGLPVVLLASVAPASDAPKAKTPPASRPAPSNPATAATIDSNDYPGKGLLKIKISEDAMEAVVDSWEMKNYEDETLSLTPEWVKDELVNAKVSFGCDDKLLADVATALSRAEDITGKLVAAGKIPIGAKNPFLYQSFKDSKLTEKHAQVVDIRELQQRNIVRSGDLIGEVRYKNAAVEGMNVKGEVVTPPAGEELVVSLGEGVEMRELGRYYATIDGVPKIEANSVAVNKALVHEGDVNLATGNIRFNGSVEIKGAIDSGAIVDVTGDLIVHGTIRGGHVRVGGTLDARSGIVTGENSLVRVRADVIADFIENSVIICGGNITVKKVMINSKVVAGGQIELNEKTGVLAGGNIACKKFIKTGKLGFPKGAKTIVSAGVDWRAKLAVDIRTTRLDKVMKVNEEDRNALRELARKKEGQKTKKHTDLMDELKERLQKARILIDKMKEHLAKAQASLTYDSESRIFVHETLYTNCTVEVGGVIIPIPTDIAGVEISPKRQRGSHISGIVAPEKAKEKKEDDKKAS